MSLPPSSPDPSTSPIPDTPTDLALLLVALRRLIRTWRDRASTAAEREARVYQRAESDLSAAIAAHAELHGLWTAVRDDLIHGILEALDEREVGGCQR